MADPATVLTGVRVSVPATVQASEASVPPGNGVRAPTEISHGTPRYTADAMRARLQGAVLVECVVETNGRCSRTRVVRGLEPSFGLNEEALLAAEQWRFRPGTRLGQPVPVLVTLEISFALR